MRITYVEDNVANIALLERICQMSKDDLITYLDADTALTEIAAGTSDLIIIDLHLGINATDGLQLSRALRNNGITEPIIAITSFQSANERLCLTNSGCGGLCNHSPLFQSANERLCLTN